jgi:Fe-S-cluster containining protein
MDQDWILTAEAICADCGGRCCHGAHPPLSPARRSLIASRGVGDRHIEFAGYHRMAVDGEGWCTMFRSGRCAIHCIKPETCIAGPFTFDVREGMLEIFLKRETICPLAGLFRENPEAYRVHHDRAVHEIARLVKELPPRELAVILMIDEPETDLVDKIPLEQVDTMPGADTPEIDLVDKIPLEEVDTMPGADTPETDLVDVIPLEEVDTMPGADTPETDLVDVIPSEGS